MMRTLWQGIRFGIRLLFKNPLLSAAALLSLALGIGANSAIFSIVNSFLLRPLPVPNPEQLVVLFTIEPNNEDPQGLSFPDYLDYAGQTQVFSGLIAHTPVPLGLNTGDVTERIWGESVTGNYFSVLGVQPAAGRFFQSEPTQPPGTEPVVVISHSLWQRRFNADPGIVGRVLKFNGQSLTVVAVAPASFRGTEVIFAPDIWVPMSMHQYTMPGSTELLTRRGDHQFRVIGRLKPGVSLEQAQSALSALGSGLEQEYPQTNRDISVRVFTERETRPEPGPSARNASLVAGLVLGMVGLVLLIACANVANLLLARASARRKEIAIRLALGASRGRLLRQLLTESIVLSVIGGAGGLLLSILATGLLPNFKPPTDIPFVLAPTIDWRVLVFCMVLSVASGVIFGLMPALQSLKTDLVMTLKSDAAATSSISRRFALRNLLVIAQVGLSVVLLIVAGLFVRSLQSAQHINPGMETNNALLMSVDLGLQGYDENRGKLFYRDAVARLEALPGVESVSVARYVPLDFGASSGNALATAESSRPAGDKVPVYWSIVGLKYFQTIHTPLLQGRDFNERDDSAGSRVAVVNETMARLFWPGQDALGRKFQLEDFPNTFFEVVGVAKDGKYRTLGETPLPYIYLSLGQFYRPGATLVMRTTVEPQTLIASARTEIRGLDENLPVYEVKTMSQHLDRSLLGPRIGATLVGILSVIALLLAAVGLYGVMAYSVSRRTREIGIRMALGARPADVLKLVIKQGMVMTVIGIVGGLLIAFVITRLMTNLLYGVSSVDAVTFIGIPTLLIMVAFLACYVPAYKATKVDPLKALRYE